MKTFPVLKETRLGKIWENRDNLDLGAKFPPLLLIPVPEPSTHSLDLFFKVSQLHSFP